MCSPRRGVRRHLVGGAGQRGQSTVEFALILPLFLLFSLCLVQLALVIRAQLSVEEAARAGARAAAVDPRPEVAEAAARQQGRLEDLDAHVVFSTEPGEPAFVVVTVRAPLAKRVPLLGPAAAHLEVSATSVMAIEEPHP